MFGRTRTIDKRIMLAGKKINFVVLGRVLERVEAPEQIVYTLQKAGSLLYHGNTDTVNVVDFDSRMSIRYSLYEDETDELTLTVRYGKENSQLIPRHDEDTIVIEKGHAEILTAPKFRRYYAPYTLYQRVM